MRMQRKRLIFMFVATALIAVLMLGPFEPASENAAAQVPGFGPVTILAKGTTPKPAFGTLYVGDCDDMTLDDDLDVMTFSAPWKIVGQSGGGGGNPGLGSPASRSFIFEKDPDIMRVKLSLHFGLEKRDLTAADLTAGYPKVADLAFSPGSVALYRANNPDHMINPYIAVFPLIDRDGMPREREFTGRYIATVQLSSGGLPEFDGWSEVEIIRLFESFYAARCLGEGLKQAWAPFAPTLVFE